MSQYLLIKLITLRAKLGHKCHQCYFIFFLINRDCINIVCVCIYSKAIEIQIEIALHNRFAIHWLASVYKLLVSNTDILIFAALIKFSYMSNPVVGWNILAPLDPKLDQTNSILINSSKTRLYNLE